MTPIDTLAPSAIAPAPSACKCCQCTDCKCAPCTCCKCGTCGCK